MEVVPEVKACESCAKAKRKCGKESPRCHRCASRDLECIYPLPARPSSFVRLQDAPVPVQPPAATATKEFERPTDLWDPNLLLSFPPASQFGAISGPTTDLELARPTALLPSTPAKQLSIDWFMSPESWMIENDLPHYRETPMPPSPYSRVALKTFLTQGQGWLSDWISTGGNPFIHKQLYSFRLPRIVQDSYTSVALYMLRTEENEDMVHRTIEERSKQLLKDEENHKTSSSLDPFGHLSRVQALLTYQIICLLDGNIHLRALAEERVPVMMAWLKQMLESVAFASQLTPAGTTGALTAARGLGLGVVDIMSAATPGATPPAATCPTSQEEIMWHTWIFSESVRRTWVFAQGIHIVYTVVLQGWAICPGALSFTAVAGVWDAPSSHAWNKMCRERNVSMNTPHEIESFLDNARPEDVDDFTKSLLEVTFGKAKMERWVDAAS
ncbi:hypothetical protein N8I77_002885 [Diaporthe amygdali]|uniref:Zn(2)-C6 fungal-type domain-containing protein n=1 Tax=Phomopsis amygdali TaxID=1214568 RepID=A0AAD9SHQ0_PHOAM|nr:hypothetical protein N8I77_002885 [Diaporthe amygdali]